VKGPGRASEREGKKNLGGQGGSRRKQLRIWGFSKQKKKENRADKREDEGVKEKGKFVNVVTGQKGRGGGGG